ncbi:alpha/beta hydrolase [Mycobacteroides immunogenum]|uniref:Peptidase S15 n=1 Tax=Mycobacteroides immunogenum TaxID=83262 RepID=A0A7V8LTS6_9MYCO|nr:alpha/beta hydrolase [Mycobacteroides immunogenum]AMT73263.1 peptidase S15 [Mycobacteroides immunogenum]ANO06424.1 peptidase S15 [Mycobacteroides immunogenum]KPG10658.1 peptidase S15 [Mycobacteroides immunogenum]KPG12795.1 peptidase S15 [Mycobacteroides immunogenum]KPG17847.1 peptidase S15 [Mycobacteroides immunogenum]
MLRELNFTSHGTRCAAWHVGAESDSLTSARGRPCVVMAHGFSGTRDTGLLGYAEAFAEAGMDVLVIDYRGFGESDGEIRQDISYRRQRQDYHAAIGAARHLPGVDAERVVLWGISYSAGHVVAVAAQDKRIAAVVSLTPATDGLVTLAQLVRDAGIGRLVRLAGHGLLDVVRVVAGRSPHHLAVVGQPGSTSLMNIPGAEEIYTSLGGPTWRNEVRARVALEVGLNRPTRYAGHLACPVLFQIGANDRVAPPRAARRTARKAGPWARVREYPVDHFDVYDGPWLRSVLDDQLEFLAGVLTPGRIDSDYAKGVGR